MKEIRIFLGLLVAYTAAVHGNMSFDDFSGWTEESEPVKENWIARLYEDKLKNYNKDARPVKNPSHNTTVYLGLYLSSLDVDDLKQQMTVNAWSIMSWTDEHLNWEPKNYMNINRVHFDQTDVWTPDIAVFNSADSTGVVPFVKVPVITDYIGRTYWFPPTHITVNCELDISEWPSDQHECLVRMGSWSHHGQQIDIQIIKHNETTDVMMSNYEPNNNWKLLNVKATREVLTLEEGNEKYVEINFSFKVKRLAKSHATYITTTALVVMIVVLLTYALPLNSFYSRLIMHLFALAILIGCYLTMFSSLPNNGGPVPFVVRYYSGTTILTLISLVSTLFLTTHACCDSTPSSNVGKKFVGILSSAPGLRTVTTAEQSYNPLEVELDLEDGPRPDADPSVTTEKGFPANQVRRVINFLMLVLFLIAFFVDYFVLRSVMK
ncbi:neuronal acetylcholine receptor subunit alpha-7-like [Palaemon carinicauda]|uniref:neuronal acetylcholine receptor subunit alpha-7-like n=1 Tax=Palaemon carinicauda TaxID=392227 RepID=UPI0035B639C7